MQEEQEVSIYSEFYVVFIHGYAKSKYNRIQAYSRAHEDK